MALIILGSVATMPTVMAEGGVNESPSATTQDVNSINDTMSVPHVMIERFNVAVQYNWQVGIGGDQLAMSPNGRDYILMGTRTYSANVFPDGVGDKYCEPDLFIAKSYNSSSQTYSPPTSLEQEVRIDNEYWAIKYGYDAKYAAVGIFPHWIFSPSATIPTTYDVDRYIWYHNSGEKHKIKGTIQYQNVLKDIEVDIPGSGLKTSYVTINGQVFSLRTGKNRCSIKAESSGLYTYDLKDLFDYTANHLKVVAKLYLRNKSYADDVVVEAFQKAFLYIDSFDEGQDGYNWLCRITQRNAYNYNDRFDEDALELEADRKIYYENIDDIDTSIDLSYALDRLDSENKKIVIMYYFLGYNIDEISKQLRKDKASISRRIKRILKELKDYL